ncbi:MAG: HD domain-containing protein [Butyrivibrio sp.]|nr:HD domain-containing protein [Butyrivibrio sp.]
MVTIFYIILLIISIAVLIYMAQKSYETIDIYYWTMVIIIPVIILGYCLKTTVTTVEGATMAFCFIYLDSTVLLTVAIFCIMHFMGIKTKAWMKILGYGAAFAHLAMVWSCIHNDMYFGKMTLIDTGYGIATKMTGGSLKFIHWIYMFAILFTLASLIGIAFLRKGTYSRRTLFLYTCLTMAGILAYGFEIVIDIDFSLLPLIYVIADILIAVNYDNAHAHDIINLISDQQKYHETKGYAAIDLEGRYLSCNEKMYEFIPGLEMQLIDEKLDPGSSANKIFYGLVKDFKEKKSKSINFEINNMICQCEIAEFSIRRDGKIQGYMFDVRDITEEQKVINVMQDYNETLNAEVDKKTENIKRIQEKVVLGLANMVENRDNNTGGHVKRTSDIIKIIVDEMRKQKPDIISEEFAEDIIRAAPMHDLGKITIDDAILCKPAKLTPEEYEIMKTHSVKSGEMVNIILKGVEEKHFVDVAYNVARYHHERWDGKGYPEGLVGAMTPLEARIMAIADVYDALVSERPYKKPMSFEQAAKIMIEGMGSQFDPNMLPVFLECREKLESYYKSV